MTLSQLFHKLKIPHTKDDIEQLVTTKATPTLFPDVKEHLTRIQSLGKYEMSVLSNGDLESLDRAVTGWASQSTGPSPPKGPAITSPTPVSTSMP